MKVRLRTFLLFLSFVVFAALIDPAAAAANDPPPAPPPSTPARPMPENPYKPWDGDAGVPDLVGDKVTRQVVFDNAELAEDPEVRDAAKAALDEGTVQALRKFLETGLDQAKARAAARKAETARQNRIAIQAMAGTGGPIFNAEVQRVLAGTDGDRADFLAYGKDVARVRDQQVAEGNQARADQLRARVTALVGSAGPNVKQAAQNALNAGDAAIAEFLRTGYLEAARKDAEAREKQLRDQEAAERAAEELSEVARRAARAMTARRNLVVAHGNSVRALQRSANAMILAANESRKAEQILAANNASGQHPPDSFNQVKAEVARQLTNARNAATDAESAAATATVEANVLVETGFTYGTQWADMARGVSAAARAVILATETAQHSIDATQATDQARNAQEKAERHAEQARKWHEHAKEHALAAAAVAEAARVQADAAKTAADRARQARVDAESAAEAARLAAERTRAHKQTAVDERDKAKAARRVADAERTNAANARARADAAANEARNARGEAQRQASIAAAANGRANEQEGLARDADGRAQKEEGLAREARDRAYAAEKGLQTAQAKAEALTAAEAAARGTSAEQDARKAADQARTEATNARTAATNARNAANQATGAAVVAREAAGEATRAAARARAAAQQAQAAAQAANHAATQAEASAAETHKHATQANVKATEATENETKAAEAARSAVALAEQAAREAVQSLRAAERTRAEADAAFNESVSAATQANMALRASTAASSSSAAIREPANTAITVVAPFVGSDLDADFVILVANQARAVGAEQAAAARLRATEAAAAAIRAADAARDAREEVKPAFEAAARAAKSSSEAAKFAADAQQYAANAAVDGAAARAAGERANQYDSQARADALAARNAANEANANAAIAGRSAAQAEREAAAARDAATRAENDARLANEAATNAENSAREAEAAAERAEAHARSAAEAAARAREHATEAQQAADRAEDAERKAQDEARKLIAQQTAAGLEPLTVEEITVLQKTELGREELAEYQQAAQEAANGGSVTSFLLEIGADVILEVIGWNDAQKCFSEGNIEACLWTVFNVLSFAAIFLKLPRLTAAVVKVIANIGKWLDKSKFFKKIVGKAKSWFKKAAEWCEISGGRAAAVQEIIFSCGPIEYDSDPLSAIAVDARIHSGYHDNGRNIAVAYVEGWVNDNGKFPNYVIGLSGANGNQDYHSEQHILDQLAAKGQHPLQVEALYSEREPCRRCKDGPVSKMSNAKVSYSVPYKNVGDKGIETEEDAKKANADYTVKLKEMIRKAFWRRGHSRGTQTEEETAEQKVLVGAGN
ncbi:hypothetical protein JOF56_008523 [Kibdelosporangium banguiense]|uniref:Methyl-accepting transducer domain-containing protein n=1 Tax=Kibdelosporangium banguiense TaxID=1365924 RepID=A0ABS4TUT9_9PSEU|nr:nucleic acid/nucleotide deaminase domain-containing protein [Kibdelosporangium banguiense]MBP2328138.1 hypothetical protein [Kibdelosporangium banguiense]